jgi:hypothetical protein
VQGQIRFCSPQAITVDNARLPKCVPDFQSQKRSFIITGHGGQLALAGFQAHCDYFGQEPLRHETVDSFKKLEIPSKDAFPLPKNLQSMSRIFDNHLAASLGPHIVGAQ